MRRLMLSAMILSVAGCTSDATPPPGASPLVFVSDPPREGPAPEVEVEVSNERPVDLVPAPEAPAPKTRSRRRMDLDQLDRAIRQVTGGIAWMDGNTDMLESLSATLGKPDFIERTNEDLTPSAMFQKFLGDAARSVCAALMVEDPLRAPAERTFFVAAEPDDTFAGAPERVIENLAVLLLSFHGVAVEPGAPELERWRWLFESAEHVSGGDPSLAWNTTCVALITHPGFYTY